MNSVAQKYQKKEQFVKKINEITKKVFYVAKTSSKRFISFYSFSLIFTTFVPPNPTLNIKIKKHHRPDP